MSHHRSHMHANKVGGLIRPDFMAFHTECLRIRTDLHHQVGKAIDKSAEVKAQIHREVRALHRDFEKARDEFIKLCELKRHRCPINKDTPISDVCDDFC